MILQQTQLSLLHHTGLHSMFSTQSPNPHQIGLLELHPFRIPQLITSRKSHYRLSSFAIIDGFECPWTHMQSAVIKRNSLGVQQSACASCTDLLVYELWQIKDLDLYFTSILKCSTFLHSYCCESYVKCTWRRLRQERNQESIHRLL